MIKIKNYTILNYHTKKSHKFNRIYFMAFYGQKKSIKQFHFMKLSFSCKRIHNNKTLL